MNIKYAIANSILIDIDIHIDIVKLVVVQVLSNVKC